MADLFWYGLSLSDPELYLEAQVNYLRSIAEFLGPGSPIPIEQDLSPLLLPNPRDRDIPRARKVEKSVLEEEPIRGRKREMAIVVQELPQYRISPQRKKPTSKIVRSGVKPGVKSRKKLTKSGDQKRRREGEIPRIVSLSPRMRDRPVFFKLINDGSKPEGDICSIGSSDEELDIEDLLSPRSFSPTPATKKTAPPDDLRYMKNKSDEYMDICPFCHVTEDRSGGEWYPESVEKSTILLKNGGRKERFSDGSVLLHYPNGDLKHTFPQGPVVYHYQQTKAVQSVYAKGHKVVLFPFGQTEIMCPEGGKTVYFPGGECVRMSSDGRTEAV